MLATITNVWDIYDIVAPLITLTVVVRAGAMRQITEAWAKTDAEDIRHPLQLLIANVVSYLRGIFHPFAHEIMGLIVRAKR